MTQNKSTTVSKFSIQDFKGFFAEQSIDFGLPNGKTGSGLTVISGPHNSGKTTIIEALTLTKGDTIPQSQRHGNKNPIIKFTRKLNAQSDEVIMTTIDGGSQVSSTLTSQARGKPLFYCLSVRRHWGSEAQKNDNYNYATMEYGAGKIPERKDHIDRMSSYFATILSDINQKKELKDRLTASLKSLVTNFHSWTVDTNEDGVDYIKYSTNNNVSHRIEFLGNGVITLFRICAALLNDTLEQILIIDEPELSLHPTAQRKLNRILIDASKNRQIILCTHSPHFINWNHLENGTKLFRLNKYKDIECTIHELKKETLQKIQKFKNPLKHHLFDIAAKEIMFAEKLLFVEGQEDAGIIYGWAVENNVKLNFDIFGYGVDGWNNFSIFLQISEELGIKKIGCLYDKDKLTSDGLEKDFKKNQTKYKTYKFLQLPTQDIRDKGEGKHKVTGIFDKQGKLKNGTEAEQGNKTQFEKIMSEFNDYFDID